VVDYLFFPGELDWSGLMLAFPALGALALLTIGVLFERWAHWVGVAASLASFAVAALAFAAMLSAGPSGPAAPHTVTYAHWIETASWSVDFGLRIDQLSILFALLVTGVGSVIHIYSVGYMAHDPRRRRFFEDGQTGFFQERLFTG
jgi:NADH-quinone oxidoreductase subunit L